MAAPPPAATASGIQAGQQTEPGQTTTATAEINKKEKENESTSTLIIVCCHAIYLSDPSSPRGDSNSNNGTKAMHNEVQNWLIEPFQSGETATFIKHVQEGVRLVSIPVSPSGVGVGALLCFSGGATKRNRIRDLNLERTGEMNKWSGLGEGDGNEKDRKLIDPNRTEAEGYEAVAIESNFFGYADVDTADGIPLRHRIFQERFATDSYQNVLLALLHYPIWIRQLLQRSRDGLGEQRKTATTEHDGIKVDKNNENPVKLQLPKKLIIISHEFKRARFLKLHLPAIVSLLRSAEIDGKSITPTDDNRKAGSSSAEWIAQVDSMEVEFVGINPPFDDEKMRQIEEGDRKRGYGVWERDLHGLGDVLSQKRRDRGWDVDSYLGDVGKWYDEKTLERIAAIVKGQTSL